MSTLAYTYTLITFVFILFGILKVNMVSAVPAIFVFGDSLLDAGNNNYFTTLAKRNYRPYGIDFGYGPTGRFTNGRTMVDVLGEKIGVKGFIPPYLSPKTRGEVILKGVNYASGSAGILDRTGRVAIKNINMNAQVDHFASTRQSMETLIGKTAAHKLLRNDSLFVIGIGSNDFILNYLLPIMSKYRQRLLPPDAFASTLIRKLKLQIKTLYKLDARKFLVADIAPLGCAPSMKDTRPNIDSTTHCYEHANTVVRMFNKKLQVLLLELKKELKGSVFVYANTYHIFSDILQHHDSYGFKNKESACCRLLGRHGGVTSCVRLSKFCPDRTKYVFWDGYHPTEAVNLLVAERILHGKSPDVYPMNVQKLLKFETLY